MSKRSFLHRLWWAVKDYARRIWDVAGEDNISFLAGGIAFNLLLAAVPFTLLLLSGLGYVLNESAEQSSSTVWGFIDNLLPPHAETGDVQLHKLLDGVIKTARLGRSLRRDRLHLVLDAPVRDAALGARRGVRH